MRIEYKTQTYEFTHGKKPSGRGMWCFKALVTVPTQAAEIMKCQSPDGLLRASGTLSEAKREIKETLKLIAPEAKVVVLKVMP